MKINAYLEQQKGFTNVGRLQGGIIAYTRELEQEKTQCKISSICTPTLFFSLILIYPISCHVMTSCAYVKPHQRRRMMDHHVLPPNHQKNTICTEMLNRRNLKDPIMYSTCECAHG